MSLVETYEIGRINEESTPPDNETIWQEPAQEVLHMCLPSSGPAAALLCIFIGDDVDRKVKSLLEYLQNQNLKRVGSQNLLSVIECDSSHFPNVVLRRCGPDIATPQTEASVNDHWHARNVRRAAKAIYIDRLID